MKQVLALALGLLLLAAPAFAHDADGKWEGMVDTPMGAIPVGFTFKTDGAMLTGTSLGPDGAGVRSRTARSRATRSRSASTSTSAAWPSR
jgi:hypothetical protein